MPVLSQCLAGLAIASPLFLLAASLTLSASVTRRFDLSLGSFAMLGAFVAWSILARLPNDPFSITFGLLASAALIALLGAALARAFRCLAPPVHLIGTLGVLLIIQDAIPLLWGPVAANHRINDLILIALGPLTLAGCLLVLKRVDATSVAPLAAGLAGLAGALTQIPDLDLTFLTDAIAVTLIGGLGSVTGAFLAALAIGLLQAFLPGASLYVTFAVLAAILIVRPDGLLGRPQPEPAVEPILIRPTPLSARLLFTATLLGAIAAPFLAGPATLSLLTGALIAILFAASLHVTMGPGGMPSLGHAAFFGIGAYAAALLARDAGMGLALLAAPLAAGTAALLVGAIIVRLSFTPFAMLTLAVGQLVWTLAVPIGVIKTTPWDLYWLTLILCLGATLLLRRALYGRFGYALRAIRDNPGRAAAIGLPIHLVRLSAFTLTGATAGLAGGLATFSQGSISPADITITKSAEALMMVLLGGIQTISGPIIGAVAGTALRDAVLQATDAWRLILGLTLIALVMLFPSGMAGASIRAWRRAL